MMDLKRQRKLINLFLGLAYFTCLSRFIPLCNQIGEEGVGLFAAAFLIYAVYMLLVREVFSEQVARMINARMRRDQYKNAGQVFDFSLIAGLIIGLIVCVFVFLLSGFLSEKLLLMEQTENVLRYMAPAFAFGTVTAVFSAYLRGVGDHITDALLRLTTQLLISLLCIIMSGGSYRHGMQVADLLHQDIFASVYGARGCGLAVSLGMFLMLLIYILFYVQTKVTFKRRTMKDSYSRSEETAAYTRALFINPAVSYAVVFLIGLSLILQERTLVYRINVLNQAGTAQAVNAYAVFGRYYGKGILFVLFPIAAIYTIYHGMDGYIRKALAKEERKSVRESMQVRLRKYMAVILPITVFTAVYAKPLMGFVSNGEIADVSGAVTTGALSVFFFGLAYIYAQVCAAMDKKLYIILIQLLAFIVHFLSLQIGLKVYTNPAAAIGIAQLLTGVLLAVIYGALMTMQLNYRHNFRHLVIPLIASAISGGLGILIVLLLNGKAADILILLIGGIVFLILYLIIMASLHGFHKKELSMLPGGEFLIRLFYYR